MAILKELPKYEDPFTQEVADRIMRESTRCTQASLAVFGIKGYPFQGSGCLQYFFAAGFSLVPVPLDNGKWTLDRFKRVSKTQIEKCNYFLLTPGHAMSIRNGILIDTAHQGWDSKRPIEHMWLVVAKGGTTR